MLESIVRVAREQGASDAHLETLHAQLALRVRGQLRMQGEVLSADGLRAAAQQLLGNARWGEFSERHSFDLSRNISGVRCRINALKTARGVSFAIRLLARFNAKSGATRHPSTRRCATPCAKIPTC